MKVMVDYGKLTAISNYLFGSKPATLDACKARQLADRIARRALEQYGKECEQLLARSEARYPIIDA